MKIGSDLYLDLADWTKQVAKQGLLPLIYIWNISKRKNNNAPFGFNIHMHDKFCAI